MCRGQYQDLRPEGDVRFDRYPARALKRNASIDVGAGSEGDVGVPESDALRDSGIGGVETREAKETPPVPNWHGNVGEQGHQSRHVCTIARWRTFQ